MTVGTPALVRPQSESSQCRDHVAWVAACLKSMQTIKPGMTRDELLKVFRTEGGESTASHRTFVSRDCPYFKVDVTFHRASGFAAKTDKKDLLTERGDDVIATISQPYLQFSILD